MKKFSILFGFFLLSLCGCADNQVEGYRICDLDKNKCDYLPTSDWEFKSKGFCSCKPYVFYNKLDRSIIRTYNGKSDLTKFYKDK